MPTRATLVGRPTSQPSAWQAVSSIKLTGEVDAGGKQNTMLPFTLSMKRPHKNRMEIVFQGQTVTGRTVPSAATYRSSVRTGAAGTAGPLLRNVTG